MDLLYARYSNPLDLMSIYINQGRFGDFVAEFCTAEYDRKKEEADKDLESKLWMAYVYSRSELPYREWKNKVCTKDEPQTHRGDENLDNEGIKAIINDLFPDNSSQGGDV